VEIADDKLGFHLKGAHEMDERLLEESKASEVFEIAEVLALIGKATAGEGEDALQMASDGEKRRDVERELDAERDKTAGAADELRGSIDQGDYRIVAALKNLAVMHEKHVGDIAEARAGLMVIDGDGLFAQIGGGHDEGFHARIGNEQMLQRRVGQENAEPRNAGSDGWSDAVGVARGRGR